MNSEKTNYEKFRDEVLSNPENKTKYLDAREKIKFEMMIETLREQVIQERSQKAILGQITKIFNHFSKIAF